MLPVIIVNNAANEQARRQRENDEVDDIMMNNVVTIDDRSFVSLSSMTTDEAIVIKNGIIHRIQEKYGSNFNTTSVAIIKDAKVVAAEEHARQVAADEAFWFIGKLFLFVIISFFVLRGLGIIKD